MKNIRKDISKLKKLNTFSTESGIFIGFKQSAMYFIAGVKNAGSKNEIRVKDVIDMKGEPDNRTTKEDKREVIVYNIPGVQLPDNNLKADYQASYEFHKNSLRKFTVKLNVDENRQGSKVE